MSEEKPPRRVRYLLFGLIGAGLLWAIVNHSFVAALTRIEPTYALLVQPDDPGVLEALADRSIDRIRRVTASGTAPARFGFTGTIGRPGVTAPTKEGQGPVQSPEVDEIARAKADLQQWAEAMLAQEPGNVRALVLLGELKRDGGDGDAAAVFMRSSAQRSIREPMPQAWLIDDAIEKRDWPLVMRHADILMRMHARTIPHLTPLVARLAESPETVSLVKDALRESPTWRTAFFAELPGAVADARTPLDLFLAIKDTPTPPTIAELRGYLTFLIQRKYFDLAYYTWLQFLPPQQLASVGPLVNGSFETRPSGLPFDWVLPVGGTASVSIARRPDRPAARGLVVNFGHGRVELGGTSQLLRLRPGDYQLEGEAQGDVVGRRSVRWRVTCLENQKMVGQSDMFVGEMVSWKAFSFAVNVPETGCTVQRLSLDLDARSPIERLVSGTIWFDEMSIRRGSSAVQQPTGTLAPQSQPRQR
jgi:hypothetical protein